ncbi:MAG: Unknown protein [uncultured Sulfurovum sp.]|uniref:Outer membrane protein beta-barrel domain-containing protein n=1 Tax=uncultured Sulfurovum sp. TaxID=269237 RepID=A0A6S6SIW9_9BACT|nr:MAG: Unknown protein [uncultured Sulfurovum sp.]
MFKKTLLYSMAIPAILLANAEVIEPIDDTQKVVVEYAEDRFNDVYQKDSTYIGVAFGRTKMEDFSGVASSLLLGMKVSDYMAFELRYSSIIGDAEDDNGNTEDLRNIAFYVKQMLPMDYKLTPYALLGYGKTTYGELSDSQMQWGLGLNYVYKSNFTVFADYESQYDGNFEKMTTDDKEMNSLKIGTTYTF